MRSLLGCGVGLVGGVCPLVFFFGGFGVGNRRRVWWY